MRSAHIFYIVFIALVLAVSCKKNNAPPAPGNGNSSPIPLPSKKCYLSSVQNSNAVTIRKLQLNSNQQYSLESDHYYTSSGKEKEYYKYYNKEVQGNKFIYQEYHVLDGNNDYINGFYLYYINKANNLFLDSVETYICTSGTCKAGSTLNASDYERLASEIYFYNSNYKLQKKQYYNNKYQPDGYTTYSYSATGLLLKEETYKQDVTLSSSAEYIYPASNSDLAFKGEPAQVERLLFGYAKSIQEYTIKLFSTSTGSSEIKWIITRFDDNSDMKGYLKSTAPENYPTIITTYNYTCEN